MKRTRLYQVSFAMLALVVCASSLHATPASPLIPTYTPTGAVSLTYTLPTTASPNSVSVSLATAAVATGPASSTYYTVDPTTVPYWLSVSAGSGTVVSPITAGSVAGTPSVLTLQASQVAATLGAGIYTTTVQLDVIGYLPLNIPVTLNVKTPAAALTATGATALGAETWSVGSTQVPFTFTLSSNSVPISYTTTLSALTSTGTTVATGISVSPASGLVYTWGTTVAVTISPLAYAQAKAGDVLNATVTINYEGTTMPISFQLTILPPVAIITSLYPASVPVDTTATDVVSFVINGTGFVASGTNQVTAVFENGTQIVTGTGLVVNVVNSTTIVVQITIGTSTAFGTAGTPVAIAVVNPNGNATPAAPTTPAGALANLNVVSVPIIDAVTSASTFIEPTAAAPTVFAPYDFITIFGTNFCPDCGGSNPTMMSGVPDVTYSRYPTYLSPDSTHYLQVQFNKHSNGALVAQGYVVFASNTQINVLVPAALATVSSGALIGSGTVDITVSYGTTAPPTAPLAAETSSAFTVGMVANDPGIFAANSDGTGQGAILNGDYSLNSSTNAALHTTGTVIVYMTGMGAPNSTASNASTTAALAYPGSCISALGAAASGSTPAIIGYLTTVNTTVGTTYTAPNPAWTSLDGAVILASNIVGNGTSHFPPCLSAVTASINGVAATVGYAGWVAGSVAGLYQVNLTVPAGAVPGTYASTGGTPISVPVLVTVGGKTSQAGVTLWIK